jgi:hypothetical protein
MTTTRLRTFPGIWIGRRVVVDAIRRAPASGESAFVCGGCEDVIVPAAQPPAQVGDFVLRCGCGQYNQH